MTRLRAPRRRPVFRDHLWDEAYIGLEAGAASIRNFEPSVVPARLLQTEDYVRETFQRADRAGSRGGRTPG